MSGNLKLSKIFFNTILVDLELIIFYFHIALNLNIYKNKINTFNQRYVILLYFYLYTQNIISLSNIRKFFHTTPFHISTIKI